MLSFPRTVPFLSSLDAPSGSRWLSLGIPMKIAIIQNKVRRGAGDDGKREKAVPLTNSQNGKTVNTRNISGMLLCCKEKANQARESTKPQPRTLICLWFVASLRALIFALIGHNTINIRGIFQVFAVLTP